MKYNEETYSKAKPKKTAIIIIASILLVASFGFLAVSLALSALGINAGGNVNFNAGDHVYAKVTGTVEGAKTQNVLEELNFDSSTSSFTTPVSWSDIDFTFAGNEITFTVNFENTSTEYDFWVKVSHSQLPQNLILEQRLDSKDAEKISGDFTFKVEKSTESVRTVKSVIFTLKVEEKSVNGNLQFIMNLSNTDPALN